MMENNKVRAWERHGRRTDEEIQEVNQELQGIKVDIQKQRIK
jgi:hypothetical protein